eukprot:5391499-Pleurochrysis_carterae.AAC.1
MGGNTILFSPRVAMLRSGAAMASASVAPRATVTQARCERHIPSLICALLRALDASRGSGMALVD